MARQRPNILFVLTDNQHWTSMGAAGNEIIDTPHMDDLAARGVLFENSFVTTPICGASRASFLTGLYRRSHQFDFRTPPLRSELAPITYPALLKASGYTTGFIGKFGIESDGYRNVEDEEAVLGSMFDHFDDFEHWGPDNYFERQPDGSLRHLTDVTGDKMVDFLRRWHDAEADGDRPFCLSVSFNAPHCQDDHPQQYIWPESVDHLYHDAVIEVPATAEPAFIDTQPDFIKQSENRERWLRRFATPEMFQANMKGYYRMVSGIDVVLGRVLDELDNLGAADSTVVIFTSDNGMFFGERGLSDCWLLYEDSIRVPLVVMDPRLADTRRGARVDALALNIDISPTIIDLAGVTVPDAVQGRSLLPLIRGDESADWREDFYCEHLFEHPLIPKSEGVRTTRWKYIKYVELPASDEEQQREGTPVKGGIGRRVRGGNRYEELYGPRERPARGAQRDRRPALPADSRRARATLRRAARWGRVGPCRVGLRRGKRRGGAAMAAYVAGYDAEAVYASPAETLRP